MWVYKAKTKYGETVKGKADAKSKMELQKKLKEEGLKLVYAKQKKGNRFFDRLSDLLHIGSVSERDKILFSKNLSKMLKSGLSLQRSLAILEKESHNRYFKRVLRKIKSDIINGDPLSEALSRHPSTFSKLFVAMVAAGEESGNLSESLRVTSEQMEKMYVLKKKVRGALIYPSLVIIILVVVATILLAYMVPVLADVFSEVDAPLPQSTLIVIAISEFLTTQVVTAGAWIAILLVLLIIFYKLPAGKRFYHFLVLHIPGISNLVKQINSARTTRTLSSLFSAGVPVLESVRITRDVLQNVYFKDVLTEAEQKIEKGKQMSEVFLEAQNLYPIFVGEIVAVGEETGDVTEILKEVAVFYEEEIDNVTKNLSTIMEPILMVIVGLAVGFFAVAMISPIYALVEVF